MSTSPRFQAPLRRIAELIGLPRPVRTSLSVERTASALSSTRDAGAGDYAFFDRLRHGKAQGYEISGLLVKPLVSKLASWTLGQCPAFRVPDNERATEALNEWWAAHHSSVVLAYRDAVALGDNYLVINADLSVTSIPPHVIHPLVADDDYSRITGWRIREVYPHPSEPQRSMTITDEYTATRRTRTVETGRQILRREQYPVLIGRVPVVHFANERGSDEMFGRAEADALLVLLLRYQEAISTALDGNKRQGRPTPVIEGLGTPQEVAAFWELYGTPEVVTLADGTTERRVNLVWDADKMMTLAGNATFSYASPASFTGDTVNLLQLLFYLYVQHTELPEWALGNAIASSRASAETQVEPLVKYIEMRRASAEPFIHAINERVLAYMGLSDVAVTAAQPPEIKWDSLTNEDGTLKLQVLTWLYGEGLVDKLTALTEAPAVALENPLEIIDKAAEEQAQREEAFEQRQEQLIAQADAAARRNDAAGKDQP